MVRLSEALALAADARNMSTSDIWEQAWRKLEQVLVERLLKCGPTDDTARYRLQLSIEVARQVRITVEHAGRTAGEIEKQIALLEGRIVRPIA